MNTLLKLGFTIMIASISQVSMARSLMPESSQELVETSFVLAQEDGTRLTNGQASAVVQELAQRGFTEQGSTSATLLSGGCGFAGCDEVYLVATAYHTKGANTRTASLAGIVVYGSATRSAKIRKILSLQDLASLISVLE